MCCNGFRILIMFLFTIGSFVLNNFMPSIPVVIWYFGSINIFTFILLGIDKLNAIKERKRVPEFRFYFFSLIGGVVGIMIGIALFRHKLNDRYFLLIEFIMFVLWLIVIFFVLKNFDALISWARGLGGF